MKYPIVSRNLDLAGGATAVSALYAIKASSTGVVDSAAPLVNGVDFTITADGKIDWALGVAAGTAPAENSFFSISYYANPRYVVVDIPHAFRDTWIGTNVATPYFAPLPVNCMAQLEFLAGSV
jgi:hypothetical protein